MSTSLDTLFTGEARANPLLAPLRAYFSVPGATASEYQLISLLRGQGFLPEERSSNALALFRVHFAVFNALYQLQDEFVGQGGWLNISPLSVWLQTGQAEQGLPSDNTTDPLRAFYLDWSQWEAATEEHVTELLSDFWRRYGTGGISRDERDQALAVLDLNPPVSYEDIKRRYRKLVMVHHPDRGGERAELQALNAAMAVLERHYGINSAGSKSPGKS